MTGDKIRRIETLKLKQAIETAAKSRLAKNIDDWAEKVHGRLGGLIDLVAAEAFDGEGTVDKIMKGDDYSKCVRAHRLISKALVLSAKDLFEDEIDTSVLERIKSMGRTPALWVQNLEMTDCQPVHPC